MQGLGCTAARVWEGLQAVHHTVVEKEVLRHRPTEVADHIETAVPAGHIDLVCLHTKTVQVARQQEVHNHRKLGQDRKSQVEVQVVDHKPEVFLQMVVVLVVTHTEVRYTLHCAGSIAGRRAVCHTAPEREGAGQQGKGSFMGIRTSARITLA